MSGNLPPNTSEPQSKAQDKPLVAVPSRSNSRSASSSPASKLQARRVLRTVVLGTLALGAGVWYLADLFAVDKTELLGYLGTSALLMMALILLAAFTVGVLRLLKR